MEALKSRFERLYANHPNKEKSFNHLRAIIDSSKQSRSKKLKKLDQEKTWYFSEKLIGMTLYVDLFAKNFTLMIEKIPYLQELGITFVHLMPLLKPREGENDGGYAVEDYKDVDPSLGNLETFSLLLDAFREAKIYVCIDYVINHVSKEHEWAKAALSGNQAMQEMFIMFDTEEIPNRYNQTVPEVLPDKCPGNFTYYSEIQKYVFTSFSDFQWDLNFKNPEVFVGMVDNMLFLANLGINMIRLDAIPFMWKELGTSCRNLSPIHALLEMLHLIKEEVCPSVALLGEAIVEPNEIVKYFGSESHVECEIMYNANLMVNVFNSFATRDVRLLHHDINLFEVPSSGSWMNYVRCHDDIGWGFNEQETQRLGMDPFAHKQFLIAFYNGSFPHSFALGENYQYNPISQDARTNGTLASLLGLEKGKRDKDFFKSRAAIDRINLAHALILFYRGFPLIYSGDEIATLNDQSYLNDPKKRHEGRWVHRPLFDWQRAEKRFEPYTAEYEVFSHLKKLIALRKNLSYFSGINQQRSIAMSSKHVLCIARTEEDQFHFGLFNFSEFEVVILTSPLSAHTNSKTLVDAIYGRQVSLEVDEITLSPYETLWLSPIKEKRL